MRLSQSVVLWQGRGGIQNIENIEYFNSVIMYLDTLWQVETWKIKTYQVKYTAD